MKGQIIDVNFLGCYVKDRVSWLESQIWPIYKLVEIQVKTTFLSKERKLFFSKFENSAWGEGLASNSNMRT